ncbi:MAG TPA: Flp family type IVb pilin [Rhizomicrobium sp.]|nr:Flp family type IVb pilin [Rhizomicrobium sp.]
MGEGARSAVLSDAGGRPAAHPHVARSALKAFFADRGGATAIEYAMIAGFLSIAIVAAVNLLGQNVETEFFSKLAAVVH